MLVVIPGTKVSHSGQPIYSVDISHDGSRFATGGGDQLVKIWDLKTLRGSATRDASASSNKNGSSQSNGTNNNAPASREVIVENDKTDDDTLLCTLNSHMNAVNCVKFSKHNTLATASDDKTVMLWELKTGSKSAGGFGLKVKNKENWECTGLLSGHSADVHDLAWSPDGVRLASCSIDNSIIIWDVKSKSIVRRLKGHDGWVQGIAWDPLDKYLATQGGDGKVVIWNLLDWSIVARIEEGFEAANLQKTSESNNMYRQTAFCRLSWAPDGSVVCASRGTSKQKSSADVEPDRVVWVSPVYERGSWERKIQFLGHRKATTVTRFCPTLFRTPTSQVEDGKVFTLCAVGSMDNSATVWTSLERKPLIVLKYFVDQSFLDIAWGPMGQEMLACAHDGRLVYVHFGSNVFPGTPLTATEHATFLRPQQQLLSALPESVDALQDSENELSDRDGDTLMPPAHMPEIPSSGVDDDTTVLVARSKSSSSSSSARNVLQSQTVVQQSDGRKRIVPVAVNDDDDDMGAAVSMFGQAPIDGNDAADLGQAGYPVKRMRMGNGSAQPVGVRYVEKKVVERETIVHLAHPAMTLPVPKTGLTLTSTLKLADSLRTQLTGHAEEKTDRMCCVTATVKRSKQSRAEKNQGNALSFYKKSHFSTRLECVRQEEVLWGLVLHSKATHLTSNASCVVVATRPCAPVTQTSPSNLETEEGSELHVFSSTGRLLLPTMTFPSLVHSLSLSPSSYLVAVFCDGRVSVYSLREPKLVVTTNVREVLASRARGVSVVRVRLNGNDAQDRIPQPLVVLSNAEVFAYSYSLQCWCLANDSRAWGSQFLSRLKTAHADAKSLASSSSLSTLNVTPVTVEELQVTPDVPVARLMALERNTEVEHTLSSAEMHLVVSELLESSAEHEWWCVTYVRKLVELVNTQPVLLARLREFFDALLLKTRSLNSISIVGHEGLLGNSLSSEQSSTPFSNAVKLLTKLTKLLSANQSSPMQRLRASLQERIRQLDAAH